MAEIKKFDFRGIKRIEIPKTEEDFVGGDFGASIINKYLPSILAVHKKNTEKETFFYEFFKGLQDVYLKERLYVKDAKNNNQIVENHAYQQVNFKTGFLLGEKRDYTIKSGSTSDDLTYLDRYMTDVDFFSKDKDLKEWVYATGIGVTHCEPRTDIIISSGIDAVTQKPVLRYMNKEEGFNVLKDSPFNFEVLDPTENFVVYSSSRKKEPLFCVSIVDIDVGNESTIEIRKQIQVESKFATFTTTADKNFLGLEKVTLLQPKVLKYIPIVEHSVNSYRQGLIELNRDLFNSINTLISSVSDIIVDNANVILVFKNVDIDAQSVKEMKKAGAIIIKDSSMGASSQGADLDTISIQIDFKGFNSYYEQRISKAYDIAGVPLASGQVTSGGDTGQARLLGGGWNNAYTVIKNDIKSFLKGDYAVLKQMLLFAQQVPDSPVNDISASEIDIKYRINQSDNFLVKAQGIAQLYNINLPYEEILKASDLFSDTNAVAQKWELSDTKAKAQTKKTINSEQIDNNSFQKDNNSQE